MPAQESYQAETRPIKVDGTAPTEAPLRWKAKPIASHSGATKIATGVSPIGNGVVQASGTSEVSDKATAPGGWNKMRIDTYVTPAQATSPADPFRDPFGDRHATRASALQLQPPSAPPLNPAAPGFNPSNPGVNPNAANPPFRQPEVVPPPTPFVPMPFNPAPPTPFTPAPAFPGNEIPPPTTLPPTTPPPSTPFTPTPPAPNNEVPPPTTPLPPNEEQPPPVNPDGAPMPPRFAPGNFIPDPSPNNEKPCPERTYNDQNCCTSDATCRAFIQGLLRDKLDMISLDITPRFEPDKDDLEDQKQREKALSLSGVRDWHSRGVTFEQRGTSSAMVRGTLQNLTNGRAIIVDEAGKTRTIPLNDLSEDDLCFISGFWGLPPECAIVGRRSIDLYNRGWAPSTMTWTASALCHKPLYFEQVQHERYGHTAGPLKQPFIDGAHFFGSAIMLPYSMALDPPWECEYALGYYRPGSCAPWHIPPFPFSPRAAMAQAGFVVGGIYIIP